MFGKSFETSRVMKMKSFDKEINRMKNYAAVTHLISAALAAVC